MRIGINRKLLGLFMAAMLLAVVSVGWVYTTAVELYGTVREMDTLSRRVEITGELILQIEKILKLSAEYLITSDTALRNDLDGIIVRQFELLEMLEGQSGDERWNSTASKVREGAISLGDMAVDLLYLESPADSKDADRLMKKASAYAGTVAKDAEEFYGIAKSEMDAFSEGARIKALKTRGLLYPASFIGALLTLLLYWYLKNYVTRPISELCSGAERISRGDFEHGITVRSGDELEDLAEKFNHMSRALSLSMKELSNERDYVESIISSINDSLIVATPDGVIKTVNRAALELLGYREEELLNRPVDAVILEDGGSLVSALMERDFTGTTEKTYISSAGSRIPVLFSGSVIRSPGGVLQGMAFVALDITERKEKERRLRLAASVFENAAEGIVITDAGRKVIEANAAFTRITGYEHGESAGSSLPCFGSSFYSTEFERRIWETVDAQGEWKGEIRHRRRNGEYYIGLLTVSSICDDKGDVTNYLCILNDITRQKQAEKRIKHLAYYDVLTDLPNRVLFLDRLQYDIDRLRRKDLLLAVLFIDLDNFKLVNDTMGHDVGDQLLKAYANRLKRHLRKGTTIARLGGDEFTITLAEIPGQDEAASVSERILDIVSEPFVLGGQEVTVTNSIGISLYPVDGRDTGTLLKKADTAMYHAKERGKNNYQFFTEEMNERVQQRLLIENNLRRALKKDEFVLHYQPVVDLGTGTITGMEALIRWVDPELGVVTPDRFIPVAEETGIISEIDRWVLLSACKQAKAWHDMGFSYLTVAANISCFHLVRAEIEETVAAALRSTRIDPKRVELEVTERIFVHNVDTVRIIMERLKSTGVRISLDDFGTGYSSLSYLKNFPVDIIKIDQSFVRCAVDSPKDEAIVRTIIAMAHNMDYEVVAEGVETKEQIEFLRKNGCDRFQGFYFSRPMDAEEFLKLLKEGRSAFVCGS